jgi:isocitrate/isopropylmalate dehydrogenase
MRAIEQLTASGEASTPDLGGQSNTRQVTEAICQII